MSNDKLTFEIHGTKNFSEKERQKFALAIKKAEFELNSEEFKTAVLLYPFEQTNGKSNQEIYDMIMSGADKFNTMEDQDIDVQITLYYSWKKTIGYTYPSTWATWVNRRFFSKFNESQIAGNVVHEYMHNMGFGHKKASDHNSVPYAIGYIIRDLIKKRKTGNTSLPEMPEAPRPGKPVKLSLWGRFKRMLKNIF